MKGRGRPAKTTAPMTAETSQNHGRILSVLPHGMAEFKSAATKKGKPNYEISFIETLRMDCRSCSRVPIAGRLCSGGASSNS
jgi:hypothetical protein